MEKTKWYLKVDESFGNYTCCEYMAYNDILKFEEMTEDWNCDDDVYTLNVCLFEREDGYRDYFTKDNFDRFFVPLNPVKNGRMFIKDFEVFKIIMEFTFEDVEVVYLQCKTTNKLISKEKLLKEYQEIILKE